MKRRLPLAVVFAIALAIVALLPLYIERTMTHVMFSDGSAGAMGVGMETLFAPGVHFGVALHASRATTCVVARSEHRPRLELRDSHHTPASHATSESRVRWASRAQRQSGSDFLHLAKRLLPSS